MTLWWWINFWTMKTLHGSLVYSHDRSKDVVYSWTLCKILYEGVLHHRAKCSSCEATGLPAISSDRLTFLSLIDCSLWLTRELGDISSGTGDCPRLAQPRRRSIWPVRLESSCPVGFDKKQTGEPNFLAYSAYGFTATSKSRRVFLGYRSSTRKQTNLHHE